MSPIGLCGGSASGKTTVANRIVEVLDVPCVVLLSMDSFYKVLNREEQELAGKNEYNFDHPEAFDFELLGQPLPKMLSLMEDTPQVWGMHTIIRSALALAHQGQPLPKMLSLMEDTPQVHVLFQN
ncbi:hypothetical protein CRUP_022206 [Coryphaenoides rupestris]|nr:hypothetical protein CRUP_022206 [Coryphaenoides rupestris]